MGSKSCCTLCLWVISMWFLMGCYPKCVTNPNVNFVKVFDTVAAYVPFLIQIPLIFPPVSHKEVRRILGWLLLPLSSCLVPTLSTKKRPGLGAPNRTQVGVCLNNPDVPHNTSPHLYFPKIWGPHLSDKWRSIRSWIA